MSSELPKIIPFFVEAGSDVDILLLTFYPTLETAFLEYNSVLDKEKDQAAILEGFLSYDAIEKELAANSFRMVSTVNKIIPAKKQ